MLGRASHQCAQDPSGDTTQARRTLGTNFAPPCGNYLACLCLGALQTLSWECSHLHRWVLRLRSHLWLCPALVTVKGWRAEIMVAVVLNCIFRDGSSFTGIAQPSPLALLTLHPARQQVTFWSKMIPASIWYFACCPLGICKWRPNQCYSHPRLSEVPVRFCHVGYSHCSG